MMKKKQFVALGMFTISSLLFVSCMDKNYDLDNVDLTLGTSGDLTLPECSTAEIKLKNVMDLKDDGVVQTKDGEFLILQDGSADVPQVEVDEISISRPTLSDINSIVSLRIDHGVGTRSIVKAGSLPNIPASTYWYDILPEDETSYSFDDAKGSVPASVKAIKSVQFEDRTEVTAKVVVDFGSEHSYITTVHLDNLSLTVPNGIEVKDAKFLYTDEQGQTLEHPAWRIADGIIYLTSEEGSPIIIREGGEVKEIDVILTVAGAVANKNGFTFNKDKSEVSLQGEFRFGGTFRIMSSEFDIDALTSEQLNMIRQDGNYDRVRPESVSFSGKASFNKDINVTKFVGTVSTDIGDIAPIELDDMPDFLNDPEVVLNLSNPTFFIRVENAIPGSAKTSVSLTGKYESQADITRNSEEIVIPGGGVSVICLAQNPQAEDISVPEEYKKLITAERPLVKVKVDGLSDILKKIPQTIEVDIANLLADVEAAVPNTYDVSVDYKIYTPLSFGRGTKLIYEGTEEDIHKDMDDAGKVDAKEVLVEAIVETVLPLDLTVSVDIEDTKGNSLKNTYFTVDDIVVPAHTGDKTKPSQHPITLTIKAAQEKGINTMLKNMDRVIYRAEATADDNTGNIDEDCYVILKAVKFTVKGGMSYDAN